MKKITKLTVRMTNGDAWVREFDGEHTIEELAENGRSLVWRDSDGVTVLAVAAISSLHMTVEEVDG